MSNFNPQTFCSRSFFGIFTIASMFAASVRSSAALIYDQRLTNAAAKTNRARARSAVIASRAKMVLAERDADLDLRLAAVRAGVLTE